MILKSQTRPLAPPAHPKPVHPGMSWAELARKEGHRGRAPSPPPQNHKPRSEMPGRIIAALRRMGRGRLSAIVAEVGAPKQTVESHVRTMRHYGQIVVVGFDGAANIYAAGPLE